ncbi:Uracil-DNA glycosylase [Lishizhenia tianjinensis]|uniref:Uracil-DNA glycosylase n=1 Tax=Lishizhenia tianjinensis TaxID=477690 RepID=A0A1I6XJ16_9FLAO|nr:uracil-DNA glycosylase [Lishizhenia tianjinensis]SFT37884.1 Uracil-DNA glycosylase [Lishizhenia tianjinensis]
MDLSSAWKDLLKEEIEQDYFKELMTFVQEEYQGNHPIYPAEANIFKAFNRCPLEQTKVVLLGQDPYHGPGQADGLCFSVPHGVTFPPSLRNILIELQEDVGKEIPFTGSLEEWAEQGVLLLNATLTVRGGQAGSHQNKGWERFTDQVIATLSKETSNIVFLLWGGYARKKAKLIDANKHLVLESGHPSPLSANRGHWFGNRHFSQCNAYLSAHNKTPINW